MSTQFDFSFVFWKLFCDAASFWLTKHRHKSIKAEWHHPEKGQSFSLFQNEKVETFIRALVPANRPTQLICISGIYLYINTY